MYRFSRLVPLGHRYGIRDGEGRRGGMGGMGGVLGVGEWGVRVGEEGTLGCDRGRGGGEGREGEEEEKGV